jgi:hypothetical protein
MTTQRFTTVEGPIDVQSWFSYNVNPSSSVTLHPEIYYTYDGTNLLGDYECGNQTLLDVAGSNLMTFTVHFPTIQSTNSDGFYIYRRYRVGVQVGNPDVTFHILTNANSSHIVIPANQMDQSLGTRGATNAVLDSIYSTYDSASRVLTLPTNIVTKTILSSLPTDTWNTALQPVNTQGLFKTTFFSEGLTNGFGATGQTLYITFKTNYSASSSSTNLNTSLWSFDSDNDLIPNTSATVTVDMWWKLDSDGDLVPR